METAPFDKTSLYSKLLWLFAVAGIKKSDLTVFLNETPTLKF
jgi:hypothetical protein